MAAMASVLSWCRQYNALVCYSIIWCVYTLYSLPPVRLKARGGWGIASIAVGEHLLASILAVCLVVNQSNHSVPIPWFIALCVWSVAVGCRSILWHQLCDYKNDRKSNTATLGAIKGPVVLRRLGERYVFPIEVVSLAALLLLSHNFLAWVLLLFHFALEQMRSRVLGLRSIIVAPEPNARFALFEYYILFFPVVVFSGVFISRQFCVLAYRCSNRAIPGHVAEYGKRHFPHSEGLLQKLLLPDVRELKT